MTTFLITSPTGAQGAAIAQAALQAGHRVRGLVRTPREAPAGIELAIGDLASGEGLRAAMAGVDVVVFPSPLDYRPGVRQTMAGHIAEAAAHARVKRIVLNTAAPVFPGVQRPVSGVLREMRERLQAGAVPTVTVQPTVYMDNVLAPWAWTAITEQGVLPYPAAADVPVAWLSHRTLGASAVAAATLPGLEGAVIDLGGPEALSGNAVAQRIGQRLGRPVVYQQVPLEAFAESLNGIYGAPVGDDVADLYRLVGESPTRLLRDGEGQRKLGVEAETFDAFLTRALPGA